MYIPVIFCSEWAAKSFFKEWVNPPDTLQDQVNWGFCSVLVPIFLIELLVMLSEVAGRQPEMPLGFCFVFPALHFS